MAIPRLITERRDIFYARTCRNFGNKHEINYRSPACRVNRVCLTLLFTGAYHANCVYLKLRYKLLREKI